MSNSLKLRLQTRHPDGAAKIQVLQQDICGNRLFFRSIYLISHLLHPTLYKGTVLSFLMLLSGCGFYQEQFGSYHRIKASSKALTEKAIISLIQDGTLQTRNQLWQFLLAKRAALGEVRLAGTWVDSTHAIGHRNRKSFVIFHSNNQVFYSLALYNCGEPVVSPEGLIGPNCDLRIESINALQSDSVLRQVEWKEASPALTEFKEAILPIIRRRIELMKQAD
ncbi:hypothetical protein [Hymenobacter qilianensis]|uniref:Uncharacterized protein n=1 Tax=Hymenobacter qilianensis TaxID=1385715 RepID=A0A7H0GRN5_9BACT|nr:hypothetical protein [Hymenobacter qilianensis]QNP50951.1 hypothetical protein H9L05_12405 [Hymenobacter qilianensis]